LHKIRRSKAVDLHGATALVREQGLRNGGGGSVGCTDDVTAIQEIGRKTWSATYSFAGDDYVANGLATWWPSEALLRGLGGTTVLVAIDSGRVVGVGNVDLRGAMPIIWRLYVLPRVQHSG